uniref:Uncharacterized protein n=1 Tax=Rhizophora mucronata TaxID=61149 RepID=A0A2P2NI51_RHIMU
MLNFVASPKEVLSFCLVIYEETHA